MNALRSWLGKCHLVKENDEEEEPYKCCAGVWCRDRREFDLALRAFLTAQNLRLIWSEEVLPAGEWVHKHPTEKDAFELARMVHAANIVELGALSAIGQKATEGNQRYLLIEEIADVEPLDNQFGLLGDDKLTVPEILQEPLFGQPDPTEAEAVPFLNTFAILDAAKVTNLLTLLETSGLKFRCLFKGKAYDELKDVAPYIVELQDNNTFTRNLFTSAGMPANMWDKEPGIFVRSAGSLDDMWKHFRKFTRVQDENGKWFYFRFWEPLLFKYFCEAKGNNEQFIASFVPAGMVVAIDTVLNSIFLLQKTTTKEGGNFIFEDADGEIVRQYMIALNSRELAKKINSEEDAWSHTSGTTLHKCVEFIESAIKKSRDIGLDKKNHIDRFVVLCQKVGVGFVDDPKYVNIQKTLKSGFVPARLISELEYDVEDLLKELT